MDDIFSVIFFIWIAFALLEGVVRKKKMPPTAQLPQEDINMPAEPNLIEISQPLNTNQTNLKLPSQPKSQSSREWIEETPKNETLNLNFTPADTMNAIILSEIFNKPKARRKR